MGSKKVRTLSIFLLVVIMMLGGGILSRAGNVYIVGTSADYPPFEWVDGNGNYVGFDMDVMRSIAILEGFKIDIKDIGFDALIPALQSGKIDIIAADMTITAERAKVVTFSDPYWASNFGVLVRKGSGLNIVTALSQGHKVGAQTGTTQADFLDNLKKSGINVQMKLYETNDLAIMDLLAGRIDTFLGDLPVANAFAKAHPDKLVEAGVIHTGGNAGFAVKKGDPKGILPLIKDGVSKLHSTGIWDNLVKAYFTGNLDKITACYAKYKHFLDSGEPAKYAAGLASCMTEK